LPPKATQEAYATRVKADRADIERFSRKKEELKTSTSSIGNRLDAEALSLTRLLVDMAAGERL
jgi:hypothetical protein